MVVSPNACLLARAVGFMSAPSRDDDLTDLLNAFAAEPSLATPRDRFVDVELLYARCRALVQRVKARASGLAGLGTTDLLHRAWERTMLVQGAEAPAQRWNSREHFFATLAKATIESIIDERRRRDAEKRGGGVEPRRLAELPEVPADRRRSLPGPFDGEDRDALRQALDEFASIDPRACTVVVLRSFWEFSLAEIAASLGISVRSVNRDWLAARAWLAHRVRELQGDSTRRDGAGESAPFAAPDRDS